MKSLVRAAVVAWRDVDNAHAGGRGAEDPGQGDCPGPFRPDWESLKQYECPRVVPRREVRHLGPLECRSASPSKATGTPGTCTMQGEPTVQVPRRALRPSLEVRLQGHLQPLEGREMGPGEADRGSTSGPGPSTSSPWPTTTATSTAATRSISRGTPSMSARRRTSSASGRRRRARHGLRFGVTVHCARTWDWFDVAHGSDKTGPLAGVPYDGMLTKADGKGQWWEGYDPAGPLRPSTARPAPPQATARPTVEKLVQPHPGPHRQVPARPALFRRRHAAAGGDGRA